MTDYRTNFENIFHNNQLMTSENIIIEDNKLIFKALIFPSTKISEHLILDRDISFQLINNQVYAAEWNKIIFDDCKFDEVLEFIYTKYSFEFKNCDIFQLNFKNVKAKSENSYTYKFITTEIKNINIDNCYFTDRFYVNSQYEDHLVEIDNFIVQNTNFKHNFRLHNCNVKNCKINNTNFDRNADFYKSKFLQENDLVFKSINFRGITIFEQCLFASKLCMEYVTFSDISHFREAIFEKGLNLDKANIEKEMNFYDVQGLESKESKLNTTQETYRIIKSNFAKIGNQIEANRFHKLELDKRADYLQKNKKQYFSEWIVFFTHKITSNMGRSWFRPLVGIVIIGILTNGYLNYKFSLDGHLSWDSIGHYIDHTFQFMSIIADKGQFEDKAKDVIHWVMFLNKVLLGYLYYQFVTAVRKDTTQK